MKLPIDWDIQPLGEMTDAEIARQLKVSRERVRQVRSKRGIPKYVEPDPEWLEELGTRFDAEIARENGIATSTVSRQRAKLGIDRALTHWDQEPLLGEVPDSVLAKKYDVCNMVVAQARWTRDIPAFHTIAPNTRVNVGTDWDAEKDLGVVSDQVLAKRHGVHPDTVGSARRRRGLYFKDRTAQ